MLLYDSNPRQLELLNTDLICYVLFHFVERVDFNRAAATVSLAYTKLW